MIDGAFSEHGKTGSSLIGGIILKIVVITFILFIGLGTIGYLIGSNTDNRECVKYSQTNGECVEYKK